MILIQQSKCICQIIISVLCGKCQKSFPLENSHLYMGHTMDKTLLRVYGYQQESRFIPASL